MNSNTWLIQLQDDEWYEVEGILEVTSTNTVLILEEISNNVVAGFNNVRQFYRAEEPNLKVVK